VHGVKYFTVLVLSTLNKSQHMAFKKPTPVTSVPESPDQLFLDLPRRKYTGLIDHQGQMLRTYATSGINCPDVALQLPTGSGKTLVGLLIAEWRRRKFKEKTVYLCPTKQLVNQVVEEARTKYGLDVDGFTGSAKDYEPNSKARYANADRVAVTTYNALFNTNPFFKDPHLVIVDDAHAAENYIAQLWTVKIEKSNPEHSTLFFAVAAVLKSVLDPYFHNRLVDDIYGNTEKLWVDKLPTPDLICIADQLREVLNLHTQNLDLRFPWGMVSDHLLACHVYLSATEILIRPLIPPTWSHVPFDTAKQRIFMSATLGAGGDLERLTGRKKIQRLAIPSGWDRQGIGRRLFVFPGLSLNDVDSISLRQSLMTEAGRSLVLVPSESERLKVEVEVKVALGYPTFSADDIETTKKPFTATSKAVAIVANRYDGIDFPGDDCRLLFIEGLPKAVNLQEKFLMGRMGANLLFNERVQTRVLQAVGRCTRGLNDYSAIVVTGDELADYLVSQDRRSHLHPELQAEIGFGIEQSKDMGISDLVENFRIFIEHQSDWEDANSDILARRDSSQKSDFPALDELASAVAHEVEYQTRMWQSDYQQAYEKAREVLGTLNKSDLQGYRALWHYLAGSAAYLVDAEGVPGHLSLAREQFSKAKEAARGIPWLVNLSRFDASSSVAENRSASVFRQIERFELVLASIGKLHNRAFTKREKEILDGLSTAEGFEHAQRLLGEMLGFTTGKVETDASPDPWWLADELGFVFEDHAGATASIPRIDATKARQAASHTDWMQLNVNEAKGVKILAVLVTPAKQATIGAIPSLKKVAYWELADFRNWAIKALAIVREVRVSFVEPGDIDWRIRTAEAFEANCLDAHSLYERLSSRIAADCMTVVEG
jgi:Type III restriction enzyme, res subunit/Helicase C-terminal domain